MAKTIRSFTATITVVSGAGSVTLSGPGYRPITDAGGYIEEVICVAPHDTFSFDFVIKNSNSNPVYRRKENIGEIVEEVHTPVRGVLTVEISNARVQSTANSYADGSYELELMVKEDW